MLKKTLRTLRALTSSYEHLTEITLSAECFFHNINAFAKRVPECAIAPVLKSNAYGHGILQVATMVERYRKNSKRKNGNPSARAIIPFIAVDSYYEALGLRKNGISMPITIIGYSHDENIRTSRLKNISFTIIGMDQLRSLARSAENSGLRRPTRFHLKIDTGMSRHGILQEEIEEAIMLIKNNQYIILEGICSHLADSENDDASFTDRQITAWNKAAKRFRAELTGEPGLPALRYFHLAATNGTFHHEKIEANVQRVGLGLFGILANDKRDQMNLRPVLEMRSIIATVKNIRKGDRVGYNGTFEAQKEMRVATVPVGYFDGIDRQLSNKGWLKVVPRKNSQGLFCPIVGRISMNITTIDVSALPETQREDEVVIISRIPEDKNSLENILKLTTMIAWEMFIHIPTQIRRTVIWE